MHKQTPRENKFLILSVITLLFLGVTQVSAANEHSKKGQEEKSEHQNTQISVTPSPTTTQTNPTITPTDKNCDDDVKNHGAFVSCVAHEHEGGDKVSDAAHSEIGKKQQDNDDDDTINVTPTISPTVSPTVSPTISPTATPTESVTPSPSETPSVTPTTTPSVQGQAAVTDELKSLISALQHLIHLISSIFHI